MMWATLGLAHTPSVITLGCLDEGDEREGGQGPLLELTQLKSQVQIPQQSREKEIKCRPQQIVQGET